MTHSRQKQQTGWPDNAVHITPELIDYHIRYGNHLRAAAVHAWFRQIGQALGLARTNAHANQTRQRVAERFATGLTMIRTSAETMRDVPDLDPADRARFLRTVLEAEAQLETLLAELRSGRTRHTSVT